MRTRVYPLFGIAMLTLASGAHAQTDNGPEQNSATSTKGLEDIIVTARRTSESMQNVPVAVTALSGDFLDRQNIVDSTSLTQLAPSLTVLPTPNSQSAGTVYIRGMGNHEPSSVSEQGVGIYLDGVYLARSSGALFDLVSLERVEVLRGPQGTLFGRNTIGGALVLTSKKPADEMGGEVKLGYGRYNDWFVRGKIDTGYIGNSNIKASISAQHRQNDGWVNNTLTGGSKDFGSLKANSVFASVEGDFGPLTATYNFDFDYRSGTPTYFQITTATDDVINYYSQSPDFGGAPFLYGPDRLQDVQGTGFVDQNGKTRFNSYSRISGHSLTLNYEASDALTIKSITSYRRFLQNTIADLSGNGELLGVTLDPVTYDVDGINVVVPYKGNLAPQRQHQFSQELQFLGSSGDLKYLGGLYYFHEKSFESNRQALTFVLEGGDAGLNLYPLQAFGGTSESKAVFGQVSWTPSSLDQKLELTLGGRYTEDKKTIRLTGDVSPELRGKVKFDNFSWLASLSYKFTPGVMAYMRFSTGYRSGGFNPRTSTLNPFEPEKAKVYEAGLKSEFLDRRLRFNLAAYITDYDNLQVQQFAAGSGGATSLTVNAGKVQLKGFEAEMTVTPIPGLIFDGSVGYTDTKYKQFLFRDPATDTVSDVADQAKPVYTPKWTLHLGGEYSQPIGDATMRMRVDYSHRTQVYFNALNITAPFNEEIRSPADDNVKARLSVEGIDLGGSKLDVGIWGDNLTNQKNILYGIDFGSLGFAGATFKKPRTYGIDAKVSF
ncbi:hypothetical protein MB02_10540 [Croceicoccus estronivorus]|uniref:TonB-dependent receptor n=1 Tax=Croceicoccus estronivorus TaxID=1172626 RepID=UPI0008376976|nr:TonB-dependent receptor [Croceicoccus estronivorus]OCC23602.1 hypothetical protein MB02_10540 [Croceicoccus estronivorus]